MCPQPINASIWENPSTIDKSVNQKGSRSTDGSLRNREGKGIRGLSMPLYGVVFEHFRYSPNIPKISLQTVFENKECHLVFDTRFHFIYRI